LNHNRLYFVRHGLTDANRDGLMCGRQWDIELNEEGHEQAKLSALHSVRYSIQHIFVSPMKRALQTAEYFSNALDIPITIRDDLAEWDLGDWDRMPFYSVEAAFLSNEDPPNGEKFQDFKRRISESITDIRRHGNSMIVSHGAVWRQISIIHGIDYRRAENCEIYEIIFPVK